MLVLTPEHWEDYELIDSGQFEKLERFGQFILRRPEPQAVWDKSLNESKWQEIAHATFRQEGSASGNWERHKSMKDRWYIQYRHGDLKLSFRLALTRFKHVGIFPEQAVNWEYIYDCSRKISKPKVLNIFAYTGGASLAAKAAGADVIHCDSIKQVVSWANANMEASKLKDIRWLVEDAFKFVAREARRGNIYQGIILDPPAYGHGPKGEQWKLEDMINDLIGHVAAILDKEKSFLVFNAYSLGFSSLILQNLLQSHFPDLDPAKIENGELFLPDQGGKKLPAGVFSRFSR